MPISCTGFERIVNQTKQVLSGESPKNRVYSLHEPDVAIIKKGKSHPDCEFGAIFALTKNDDGLILSHAEYQHNVADVKTLGRVITEIIKTPETVPERSPGIEVLISPSKSRRNAVEDGV